MWWNVLTARSPCRCRCAVSAAAVGEGGGGSVRGLLTADKGEQCEEQEEVNSWLPVGK